MAQNKDQYNTVYICDESSMISNRKAKSPSIVFGSGFLLKDIFQFIGQRKIIFVGDLLGEYAGEGVKVTWEIKLVS